MGVVEGQPVEHGVHQPGRRGWQRHKYSGLLVLGPVQREGQVLGWSGPDHGVLENRPQVLEEERAFVAKALWNK